MKTLRLTPQEFAHLRSILALEYRSATYEAGVPWLDVIRQDSPAKHARILDRADYSTRLYMKVRAKA